MKKVAIIVVPVILALVGFLVFLNLGDNEREIETSLGLPEPGGENQDMKIGSTVFEPNQLIPAKYTCDGENINPPLQWSEVPEGTVSLVLIMDDPDVPRSIKPDGIWDHWLIWNIPPETTEIREGEEPVGVLGKNTGGNFGYQGPCPPDREHRYFFKLYALDKTLDLVRETTTKKDLEAAMRGHILAQTELMGRYDRAK